MLAVAFMAAATTADAKIIEHQGDRYIINVEEMELNGEENVLDILMMCPEIMSQNGRTTSSPTYMGYYTVRINNLDINMDQEAFLKNTKAKELKKIKVCINPGVMKGSGGMKKVIDLYFRKDTKGTHGKVAVEGDTKASGEVFGRVINQSDKAWIQGMVFGKMQYVNGNHGGDTNAGGKHEGVENANINVDWDITSKDNLLLQATQKFERVSNVTSGAVDYSRNISVAACYTRSLADNGAYAMVQVAADYSTEDQPYAGFKPCTRSTSPYGLVEFGFPFIHKNIYVTAGIESGYSATTAMVEDFTDRDRYADVYAQADWTCGKWGIMIGDRFRSYHVWIDRFSKPATPWEHTTSNNYFTASVYCNINDHNTLQGTFARRFYGADCSMYHPAALYAYSHDANDYAAAEDVFQSPIYVSELRYTYQKSNFNLMALVKNEHKKIDSNANSDNILTTGISAFYHIGVFRVTAGVDYNWERYNYGAVTYSNWVSCHLAPQVSLKQGWRFTANAIYNSRRLEKIMSFYQQPNFYLDIAASKEINKHWLVEAKWHDIVDTRVGARGASVGATYTF